MYDKLWTIAVVLILIPSVISFGFVDSTYPKLTSSITPSTSPSGGGNSSGINESYANTLYIRQDGTSSTSAIIPFDFGIETGIINSGSSLASIIGTDYSIQSGGDMDFETMGIGRFRGVYQFVDSSINSYASFTPSTRTSAFGINTTINGKKVCLNDSTNCPSGLAGGNPFNQVLNTTSNVTFYNVTSNGNILSAQNVYGNNIIATSSVGYANNRIEDYFGYMSYLSSGGHYFRFNSATEELAIDGSASGIDITVAAGTNKINFNSPVNFAANLTSQNICYSNGSNCQSSGTMNFTNIAMTNQTNIFSVAQNFTGRVNANGNLYTPEIFMGTQYDDSLYALKSAGSNPGAKFELVKNQGTSGAVESNGVFIRNQTDAESAGTKLYGIGSYITSSPIQTYSYWCVGVGCANNVNATIKITPGQFVGFNIPGTTSPLNLVQANGDVAAIQNTTQDIFMLGRPTNGVSVWAQAGGLALGRYDNITSVNPKSRMSVRLKAGTGNSILADTDVIHFDSNKNVTIPGQLYANDYYSGDGSRGITSTANVTQSVDFIGLVYTTCEIVFKDGLAVSESC